MNKTIVITGTSTGLGRGTAKLRRDTDCTDRLRYGAGEDAVQLLASRRAVDDDAFFAGMKAEFGG
jgi:NAD(P)-dependent dehydrogenase (short-subunit alcohol dehydrogenase family)